MKVLISVLGADQNVSRREMGKRRWRQAYDGNECANVAIDIL